MLTPQHSLAHQPWQWWEGLRKFTEHGVSEWEGLGMRLVHPLAPFAFTHQTSPAPCLVTAHACHLLLTCVLWCLHTDNEENKMPITEASEMTPQVRVFVTCFDP